MPLTRELLRQLIGDLPPPAPLEPVVHERVDLGDVVRERVSYTVEPGERVPAYLLVPAGRARPGPAVLCLHQHAGQFHLGKSEPAGLDGNPEQHYALELARRGYVTLVADALCFEERQSPHLEGMAYERFEFTHRLLLGSTLQAKMLGDARRALDYLTARPEVDPGRIGCIGHSLGGQQTLFTTALDERIACAAASCGFATLSSILAEHVNHNFTLYLPGLLRHGEVGDILALCAPRPFWVGAGQADRIFPWAGVQAAIDQARPAYAATPDRLRLVPSAAGHAFTDALRADAYAWLDQWLGVTHNA